MASYGLTQTIPPGSEPVTRAEAKLFTRNDVLTDIEDAFYDSLISSARQRCERVSGRQLITATWLLTLPYFPGYYRDYEQQLQSLFDNPYIIRMPRPPLQSITLIQYVDPNGVTQTLSPTKYRIDTNPEPGILIPEIRQFWPVTNYWLSNAVRITFVAGYTTAPDEIKQAILKCIDHEYDKRSQADEEYMDKLFEPFSYGGYP